MDILKQCQIWHEKDEPQKIVDVPAALPEAELTPEIDTETNQASAFRREASTVPLKKSGVSSPEDNNIPENESAEDAGFPSPAAPKVYTPEEMAAVKTHIRQYFGEYEQVFHEWVSPDVQVDICVVSPTKERDCCILVTTGMGAHRMNPPKEQSEHSLERAELAIALPAGWKRTPENFKDDRWYWPVHLLKDLAGLSIGGTRLGRGCVIDHQKPFAANTWLCAALLAEPFSATPGGAACTLPSGETVHFYQVLPLYRDELKYNLEHGTDALLEKMAAIGFVVRPDRPDAITRGILRSAEDEADDILEMDNGIWHLATLRKKKLPVDELNAFSHMTIYLRWCMEHDLMGAAFLEDYGSLVKQVKANPGSADLRVFLRDKLNGQLISIFFNQTGRAFASYYYGYTDDPPHYPSDIDNYAVSIIGPERNYSDEIQDEAYLFIPFDEKYYQAMARVISQRFAGWQGQNIDESTLKPSRLARAIMEYLDCECTYFPSMKDDDPISAAYSYARRDSAYEGFVPVLIRADDQSLWECLIMNSDPDSDGGDGYAFDPDKVASYRKKMLAAPIKDGKAVLDERTRQRREEAEDDAIDWEQEILGKMKGGSGNNRFASYWDIGTQMTHPLILAKIPAAHPWEIFAYLPFGNWNECPDTPELMAAAKYWFEQYGAAPAAMSHDELEFTLPSSVSEGKAIETAAEMYGLCPDVLDQGTEDATLGTLADVLRQSTVWYFWWD